MLESIVGFIQLALAPLSSDLVLIAILSGVLWGALYNHNLKLRKSLVYHKAAAGVSFILFVFTFRALSALLGGAVVANPAGWIGISLLWITYCLSIWVGQTLRERY